MPTSTRSRLTSGPPPNERRVHLVQQIAAMPRRAVLLAISAYKVTLSPWFHGSCRFTPSCSTYAYEAVSRFGAIRGGWLALKRLAKCHPFGAAGFDPVPASMHDHVAHQGHH